MTTTVPASPSAGPTYPGPKYPGPRALWSWILFDWATQPYFSLVTTFIFAPFFVAALAADPVSGQAMWGYATGAAGLAIAVLSPLLGGIADLTGPRKPWIALFGVMLVLGAGALWFAVPGHPAAVMIALGGYVIATIGAEFATVFNNAMMTRLVPPDRLGWLSGTGWAVGYLGGLIALAFTLAMLAANPETGLTLTGNAPLFGLDPVTREGDRASGPLAALWFMVFVLPLLLFTPDAARTGIAYREAAGRGLSELKATWTEARALPGMGRFLVANMVYQDGLAALFAFGAIYAAGVFGWSIVEVGTFGILLLVAGTCGAWAGGGLDDRLGGKPVIMASIVVLVLACIGILSLGPAHVLFVIPVQPATPGDGLFGSAPEQAYLGLGVMIGFVAGPLQAASRSLCARLSPPARSGRFFGLFALSGKVTSFVGPVLVALATTWSGRQDTGLVVLIVLFAAGGVLLAGVRTTVRTGSGS